MELRALTESAVSRRTVLGGIAAGAVTLVAGCTFGGSSGKSDGKNGSSRGAGTGQKLSAQVFAPIASLDPHYVNAGTFVTPCGLLEGLVAVAPSGKDVVPAIAEKWDVSADQLTYTFHLRADAKFSNGDPISAKDFEWSYQRLLTPTGAAGGGTVGTNSYQASMGIKGAADYLAGTSKDWSGVGIKATDDKTLAITLESPNSALLLELTHVSMLLLHPPTVQKHPKDWMQPANWVGSGPYTLTGWNPTASLSMKAHDHYWDRGNVHIDEANFRVITDAAATILAFRNNELDICWASLPAVGNDTTLLGQLQSAPGYSIDYYQTMFSKHPASRDPRVLQALTMAIDRTNVAKVQVGSAPGVSLVPSSVPGWDKSLAIPHDPDQARSLLAEAGYPGGQGMPTIQFLDTARRAETDAVIDMWQSTLGVKAKYNLVDAGAVADLMFKPIDDPNVWGFSYSGAGGLPTFNHWVIDTWGPSQIPFLSLTPEHAAEYLAVQADTSLSGTDKAQKLKAITDQYATPEAKKFAADATAAAAITDPDKRTAAFLDAARERQQIGYHIPLDWNGYNWLVKPSVHDVHIQYAANAYYLKGITKSQ